MAKNDAQVSISTLIGQGAELAGDFSMQGSARIDGIINGDVSVSGALIIGVTGKINGDVTAEATVIGGEVQGNITVTEKVELMETAKVLGDIATKVIVIDEHAVFQGRCDMNQDIQDTRRAVKKNAKALRNGKKTAKLAIAEALREVQAEVAAEEKGEETAVNSGAENSSVKTEI